ncbi:MAG: hypothetical protein IPJ24_15775 [bacterium]|nr:hypothetical protein [bacterium]
MPRLTRSSMRRALPATALVAAAVAVLAGLLPGCSGDDPASPQGGTPYRLVAPLENAVTDVPLLANQPTTVTVTLQLPPDIPLVSAAEIDVAATLDHVRIDGIPLWKLIARKMSRLLGKADEVGATATIRVGSDPLTVCESGISYGPFMVSHGTALVVDPPTVSADDATLDVINMGSMVLCITITANIDATLSVDAVAMDITEGRCASPANFAGTWTGTYSCGNSCVEPFGGDITLVVTQNGTQVSYTDDAGDTFTGVVCGDKLTFERFGEFSTERGTLTLESDGSATKRSTWRSNSPPYCGGDCIDYLTRSSGGGDCTPLLITSGQPPNGRINQAYSFVPTTSGGEGQVTRWAIPVLPIPGLETQNNGTLSGTPTGAAYGTWDVRVTVYDQCDPEAQVVAQTYTISITE